MERVADLWAALAVFVFLAALCATQPAKKRNMQATAPVPDPGRKNRKALADARAEERTLEAVQEPTEERFLAALDQEPTEARRRKVETARRTQQWDGPTRRYGS